MSQLGAILFDNFFLDVDTNGLNPYQAMVDLGIIVFAFWIIFQKPKRPEKPWTKEQIDELCDEWVPEPLIPKFTAQMALDTRTPIISGSNVTHVTIEGKQVLNLARYNFLGFISNKRIEEAATKTLYVYGVGTCGPRQFYGTIDVHLNLEKRIADFMKTEDTILFSYGVVTSASSLPAFAGRGDILVVDKGISIGLQIGVNLTRSEVHWFEHNDMADLERVLKNIESKDRATKRKITRRFVVIEGVYFNSGDIAPLPKIVELKNKYKWRLMMEDLGIGNLGKTGRGTCEHFNVSSEEIDLLTGNLEYITGSVGGFCTGKKNIVFHQKLNANGYVYSASLPPLLAAHSQTAFDMIDENPKLLEKFHKNVAFVYEGISKIAGLHLRSNINSPLLHIELANPTPNRYDNETLLQIIVDEALDSGVLLTRSKYTSDEKFLPAPSIRLCVCAENSLDDLKKSVEVIKKATAVALSGLPPVSSTPKVGHNEGPFKRSVSSQGF